jgi:hypothetical protein
LREYYSGYLLTYAFFEAEMEDIDGSGGDDKTLNKSTRSSIDQSSVTRKEDNLKPVSSGSSRGSTEEKFQALNLNINPIITPRAENEREELDAIGECKPEDRLAFPSEKAYLDAPTRSKRGNQDTDLEVEKAKKMGYEGPPQVETEDDAIEKAVDDEVSGDLRKTSRKRSRTFRRRAIFGEFVEDVSLVKVDGQELPGLVRLDTGMTLNAVSYSVTLLLGYPIEEYNGGPFVVVDGSEWPLMGQVVIPFNFVDFRSTQMWYIKCIVFDEFPYDICLGRGFISESGLLKRPPGALPVELKKLRVQPEAAPAELTEETKVLPEFRKVKLHFYRRWMARWVEIAHI